MTTKEYARWHRLALEALMDVVLAESSEVRLRRIISAEEYAKIAFDQADDNYTLALNHGILGTIHYIKLLIVKRASDQQTIVEDSSIEEAKRFLSKTNSNIGSELG